MKRSTITLILLFVAGFILSVDTMYGQTQDQARGSITMPSGLTVDAATVMLRFRLGEIDHEAASTAIAMLQCMEQALEIEGNDFTWEECRDRGYAELKKLLLQHNNVDKEITDRLTQKKV